MIYWEYRNVEYYPMCKWSAKNTVKCIVLYCIQDKKIIYVFETFFSFLSREEFEESYDCSVHIES